MPRSRLMLGLMLSSFAVLCIVQILRADDYKLGQDVEVLRGDVWSKATVVDQEGTKYQVHYTDAGESNASDEWVHADRIRQLNRPAAKPPEPVTAAAPPPPPAPAPAAPAQGAADKAAPTPVPTPAAAPAKPADDSPVPNKTETVAPVIPAPPPPRDPRADAPQLVGPWTYQPEAVTPLPKCTGSVHLPDQSEVEFLVPPRPSAYLAATKVSNGSVPVETFDVLSGEVHTQLTSMDWIREPVFDPAGDYIAGFAGGSADDMEVWSLKENKAASHVHLDKPGADWHVVDFPSPGVVLTYDITIDGNLHVWDIQTGKLLRSITVSAPAFDSTAKVSPGGKYVALATDQSIRFFNLQTGESAGRIDLPVPNPIGTGRCAVAFSPDGTELALIDQNYERLAVLRTIDLRTGRQTSAMYVQMTSPAVTANMVTDWATDRLHLLQYLADNSGFVISHECIIDRVTGRGIFEFPQSVWIHNHPVVVISPSQILCTNIHINPRAPEYANHTQTIENLTLPKELTATIADVHAGGDVQDAILPPLAHPVMAGVRTIAAVAGPPGPGPVELAPAAAATVTSPPTLSLLGTYAGERPFVFATVAQQVFVEKHYGFQNDAPEGRSSIESYSLTNGKRVMSIPFPAECEPMDVSPDGLQFIVRYRRLTGDRIDVCSVNPKDKPLCSWVPNAISASQPGSGAALSTQAVWAAQFVDKDHVVTQGDHDLIVWQLSGCKPIYKVPLAERCQAALSNARGFLAVPLPPVAPAGSHVILFVAAATGVPCGSISLSSPVARGSSIGFSPDGKSLFVTTDEAGSTALWKYDLATGAGTRIVVSTDGGLAALTWMKSPYGLAGKWLIDGSTGQVLAKVDPASWTNCQPVGFDGRLWIVSKADLDGASLLVPVNFPDKTTAASLSGAAANAQNYAIKPGDTVSLKITIPGTSDEQIQTAAKKLTARLTALGIHVADGSPIQLVMSYGQGRVTQTPRIPLPLNEFDGRLEFRKNDKPVWQTTWTAELSGMFNNARGGGEMAHLKALADIQLLIDQIPDQTIPGLISDEWTGSALTVAEPPAVVVLLDPARNDPKRKPVLPVAPVADRSTRTVATASEAEERAELKVLKKLVDDTNDLRSTSDELAAGIVKSMPIPQFTKDINQLEHDANVIPDAPKNLLEETADSLKQLKGAALSAVADGRTYLRAYNHNETANNGNLAMGDLLNLYKTQIGPETDFLKKRLEDLQAKYPQ